MPDFVLDHEPDGFARIKVVGVGGGGCNAVDSMFDLGLQNVEFYVINSDLQALKRSKCPNRIQIGAELTRGRGCGASPDLGERCMKDAKDEIAETLNGADIVFVTAGLGGGTGTGASPVVAQVAKEMGILTVAVVTRPFKFEGPRRLKSAEAGLAKLRDNCDTMIVINNERLLEVVGPKVPMRDAFKIADNVLAQAVTSISDLVSTPGLINVDFEDIRTIMGGRGGAVMGVGVGKGENRSAEAVKKATSSPLLDKIVIDGATGILICVTGGPDMTLFEADEAAKMVQEAADPDAEIIFGAVIDESMTDQMRVTLIATGFSDDVQRRQFAGAAENTEPAAAKNGNGFSVPKDYKIERPAPAAPAPAMKMKVKEEEPTPAAPKSVPVQASSVDSVEDHPIFEPEPEMKKQPVAVEQPNSLRDTLKRMMAQQGKPAGSPQSPIRVAKSSPVQTNGGSHGHPAVRPAAPKIEAQVAKPAIEEAAPRVTLFDAEQEEAHEEQNDLDTPAFLRRRRSLFE